MKSSPGNRPALTPPRAAASRSRWRSFVAYTCLVFFVGLYSLHAIQPDKTPGHHHGKYPKVQVERLSNLDLPKTELKPAAVSATDSHLQPNVSQAAGIPSDPQFRDHPTRAPPSLHS